MCSVQSLAENVTLIGPISTGLGADFLNSAVSPDFK